jgi:tRNA(Ile)-lysidine synthase
VIDEPSVELSALGVLDQFLDPSSLAPIAVGLSGGGDSTALLHLALRWAATRGRPVLALTVDHGLSPESERWTREAGDQANRMGATWRGMKWEGEKPASGVQAAARSARHAMMATAARTAEARVLLLGHTADDAAENDVMRASDTAGLGRLRAWAPSPAWPQGRGLFVLRPLLGISRAEIRAYLTAQGESWLEDPANEDVRFARVRARQAEPEPNRGSPSVDPQLPELAKSFSFAPGCAFAPLAPILRSSRTVAHHLVGTALLSVSGRLVPPRSAKLARLLAHLREGKAATLSGCRVHAAQGVVSIVQEDARRGEAPPIEFPSSWAALRFMASCGLMPNEAAVSALNERPPSLGFARSEWPLG